MKETFYSRYMKTAIDRILGILGVNDVISGLTGWAQINGRDELEIEDKARLDGEYVQKMSKGDIICHLN